MPQLDTVSYFPQYIWLVSTLGTFLHYTIRMFAPKLSRMVKSRGVLVTTGNKVEESQHINFVFDSLGSSSSVYLQEIFNQNTHRASSWLDASSSWLDEFCLNTNKANPMYLKVFARFFSGKDKPILLSTFTHRRVA